MKNFKKIISMGMILGITLSSSAPTFAFSERPTSKPGPCFPVPSYPEAPKYVNSPSDTIKKAVNSKLGYPLSWDILLSDAAKITSISIYPNVNFEASNGAPIFEAIKSIRGISSLVNLKELNYQGSNTYSIPKKNDLGDKVEGLDEIANLTKLEKVCITNTSITNINFLRNAEELKYVDLSANDNLTDITALRGKSKLIEYINIDGCKINEESQQVLNDLKKSNPDLVIIDTK